MGRQAHLPFGEDFGESGSQEKHHFTGYERDSESGTDYAKNRQYAQGLGRFNRPDPYGGSYEFGNPQSFNRYAYVSDDPINQLDPDGLACQWVLVPIWGEEGRIAGYHWVIACGSGQPDPRKVDSPDPDSPVEKNYHRKFKCNKKAEDVLKQIEKDFSKFVNGSFTFGPGDALIATVTFGSAPVTPGGTIPITQTTVFPTIIVPGQGSFTPPPVTITTSVTVYNVLPDSFTFVTNPGHPLFPGRITFRSVDAGDGKIRFSIDINAQTNGLFNDFFFGHGGSALEDKIWNNLIDNVEKFCEQ